MFLTVPTVEVTITSHPLSFSIVQKQGDSHMITQMLTIVKFAWNYYNLPTVESEEGQGMAEYALILALIAVVVALALPTLATAMDTTFGEVEAGL
jgi:Flp pilus assembly pilin Flp